MATLSITVPDADVPRVQEAIGVELQLRNGSGQQRNATTAEVQGYIAAHMKAKVYAYEDGKATKAASAGVTNVNFT